MATDDDFTFCKVAPPVNEDSMEAKTVVQDIREISIEDESSGGDSSDQRNGILWKDNLASGSSSLKQGTAGSLSFIVIDSSSQKEGSERTKQGPASDAGTSVNLSQQQKSLVKKPAPRAKVPFEKGYSQMDWLKLTRTHPDLAGFYCPRIEGSVE